MRGDTASLYDAHADRLYAYCWSLVGDQLAAAAVGDAFTAAVHRPPRGDTVLGLYALARSACAERGAFAGNLGGRGGVLFTDADPLLRAAGALRADHREVLLLWAGKWLEPHDIARVVGIAPDTVAQLIDAARTRLERSVLDLLMRGATAAPHELITAFEKKRLPWLLARRAPARAPGWLRDRVLAACEEEEAGRQRPTATATGPLVVIGSGPERGDAAGEGARARRGPSGGVHKGLGAAAGVAASAAAVVGLLLAWPSPKNGGNASIAPTATNGGANSGGSRNPADGLPGADKATSGTPGGPQSMATRGLDAGAPAGGYPGGGMAAYPPAPSRTAAPSKGKNPTPGTPSRTGTPTTAPTGGTPAAPPGTPSGPATPPGGSGGPTAPPGTPSAPPSDDPGTGDPGAPSPDPTANPEPSPSGG